MKFRTICSVLEEIIERGETLFDADIVAKAQEARSMAKRMQKKLDFFNLKKGYGREVVGDSRNGYRWMTKKAKGKYDPSTAH